MGSKSENRRIHIWINDKEVKNDIKSIGAEYRRLRNEVAKTTRGSDEYNHKVKELRKVKGHLDDHRAKVNGVSRSWQMMKNVMVGVFGGNLVLGGLRRLTQLLPTLINKNAELSDSYADVMKTTGLTDQQVKSLDVSLKKVNTRTARKELLELARDAGKLGITGEKNILQFVKAADQINVALGEDLGEGAIKDIGKLNEVFKVTARYGGDLEKSMLATGSAINSLGQASTAQEGFLVDYAKRLAGINEKAGISIENTLAYAATLDQLGQQVETSSTAMNKLTVDMFANTAEYAGIAGMEVGEFSALLNSDANEAMIRFLEGLNGNNEGMAQMVNKFEQLGIDGARSMQVIAALAGSTQLLREQQSLANKEFVAATSLTEEFNTKNENAAASLAKIQKYMENLWTNSTLFRQINNFLGRMAKVVEVEEDHIAVLERERGEMNFLIRTLNNQNLTQEARRRIIDQINTKYGEYLPQLIDERDTLDQIKLLQEAANKELLKKIIMMSYQEEIKEILEAEKEALEGVVESEVALGKARQEAFENADPSNVKMLEYQQQLAKSGIDIFQSVIDETDKKTEQTEEKYKKMAEKIGFVWDELMAGINGATGALGETSIDTETAITNATEEETKKRKDDWLSYMKSVLQQQKEMREKYLEEERRANQTEFENLEEDYENRLISYEEFLDRKHELMMADRVREDASNSAPPEISDPTTFLEWFTSGQGETLLGKIQVGYEVASQLYGNYLDIMHNLDQKRLGDMQRVHDGEVSMLDKQLQSQTISQESYNYQREKAEQDYQKRTARIKLAAWKREKRAAIIQATINTALMISQALATTTPFVPAGLIAGGIAATMGAGQVAAIAMQPEPQFARGGMIPSGASHAQGGIKLVDSRSGRSVGEMEGGEPILTRGVTRDPRLLRAASDINVAAGGRPLVSDIPSLRGHHYFDSGGISPTSLTESMDIGAVLGKLGEISDGIRQIPSRIKAEVSLDEIDRGYRERGRADALS